MGKVISIGKQNFASLRENDCFYIDKSELIREWWESQDDITLVTRPRRFGKTLNMSMLNCFFSNQYAGKKQLFEGLSIWNDEKYRGLQGSYPVIFLSFASIKGSNYMMPERALLWQLTRHIQNTAIYWRVRAYGMRAEMLRRAG